MKCIFYAHRAIGPLNQQAITRHDFKNSADFFPHLPSILNAEIEKARRALRHTTLNPVFRGRVKQDSIKFIDQIPVRVITFELTLVP